jgi:hypothetical protein
MAITEAGSFWAADMLWRLDMMSMRDHGAQDGRHARHHEDVAERVSTGTAASARRTRGAASSLAATRSASATSCGNDFPHPEGTWPAYVRS